MSCRVCIRSPKHPAHERVHVAGTWDFKWPLDTTVQVLFQRPSSASDEEFESSVREIVGLAGLWQDALAEAGAHLQLKVEQQPSAAFAPIRSGDRTKLNRSPLTASITACDVIVSLDRLFELSRRDPRNPDIAEAIRLPIADLGSYARRADSAAPSAYLGPFGWPEQRSSVEWYKTDLGKFAVLHAFGHILGLPHAHQNPRDTAALQFKHNARSIVERRLGIDVPDDFVDEYFREQIEQRWPGNIDFSDWPSADKTAHSVMSVPYYGCLIQKHHAGCNDTCRDYQAKLAELIKGPTATDIEWLGLMYNPDYTEMEAAPSKPVGKQTVNKAVNKTGKKLRHAKRGRAS